MLHTRATDVTIVGKRASVCGHGKDCASALHVSSAHVLVAECVPFCALQACIEDRRCWLDSGYMLFASVYGAVRPNITHFLRDGGPQIVRSILGLVVWFNSGCMFMRQSPFPSDISRSAWFDSGYTSCVSPGGLRTKSICAQGIQECGIFGMKSCSSSSPPQMVISTSDMRMMESRALG